MKNFRGFTKEIGQKPIKFSQEFCFFCTKVIKIAEGKSAQIRVDATNVWNHAQPTRGRFSSSGSRTVAPGDFSGNITMGNLTGTSIFDSARYPLGYLDSKVGARTFQAKFRFDF